MELKQVGFQRPLIGEEVHHLRQVAGFSILQNRTNDVLLLVAEVLVDVTRAEVVSFDQLMDRVEVILSSDHVFWDASGPIFA